MFELCSKFKSWSVTGAPDPVAKAKQNSKQTHQQTEISVSLRGNCKINNLTGRNEINIEHLNN